MAAKTVVFVTGVPGAGKTLCGLNAVFGPDRQEGAAFLTGNVPLVAVLRAALARDAVAARRLRPRRSRSAAPGPSCRTCTASSRIAHSTRTASRPSG